MLKETYPQVRFIQSETNVGFAKANNMGANQAQGNVLLFLNPDTEVKDNAIGRLYHHHQQIKDAGIVGCRLLNGDGTLQISCVQPFPTIINQVLDSDKMLRWLPNVKLWNSALTFDNAAAPVAIEMITGACMMVSKKVFESVGQFSADFFMYAEEFDLCYKTMMANYRNYYVPDVEIIHYGGGSTQNEKSSFSYIMMREAIYRQLRKINGPLYGLAYRLAMCVLAFVRLTSLALFLPVWLLRRQKSSWEKSINKWVNIFRWGVGLEKVAVEPR
jgi:GT2 family glycosyltransferase